MQLIVLCAAASGCAGKIPQSPPSTPFKDVATVRQLMDAMTVPASAAVFTAAGDAPQDDAAWMNVERSAIALAESGNLLMLPGRAVLNPEWNRQSVALIEAATLAVSAAESKNAGKLAEAGDAVYAVCESCHQHFKPQR